jgi:hypothetical protein
MPAQGFKQANKQSRTRLFYSMTQVAKAVGCGELKAPWGAERSPGTYALVKSHLLAHDSCPPAAKVGDEW